MATIPRTVMTARHRRRHRRWRLAGGIVAGSLAVLAARRRLRAAHDPRPSPVREDGLRTVPGPRGYPIVGAIPDIQRDNIAAFMDNWHKYGDLVYFPGPLNLYLPVHPDYVKHVLQDNHRNYPRPEFVQDKLKSIVGEGLVANEGEVWRRSRRLAQPAFHRHEIARFAAMFAETTGEMLAEWAAPAARGEPIDVKSAMMHLSLTNLAKALFKSDLRTAVDRVETAVAFLLAHTNRRLTSPFDPQRLPLPSSRRFNAELQAIDEIIFPMIAERRRTVERGVIEQGDLVTMLLQARDEETGEGYTDEQIRDEVVGFFIAGHETVSSALTWTWYLLSKNPDAWRRVKAEVDEVLGDRVPTVEDVAKLQYTTMVLYEALRLYPPIFVLMRCAQQDDNIGGYHIPAGANVALCAYVTHRHPDFWENPEGFDPERFTAERSAGRHRMAFFSFAGGPRKCIGDAFAMLEMPIVVAMVAQRYRPTLVPGRPVVPNPAFSLRPRDAMLMNLEPLALATSMGTRADKPRRNEVVAD